MNPTKIEDYNSRTLELAKRLEGMSYAEWRKLSFVIEQSFEKQKREQERSLLLASADELADAIQYHFG